MMKIGDQIHISACKSDGMVYRSWEATIESVDADSIITIFPAGSMIIDKTKLGDHPSRHHLRSYYWHDRFYNLIEVFHFETKELIEIYINIAAPPQITENKISFKDYELDVIKDFPDPARIVDEDEFAEAIPLYGYSKEFQEKVWGTAREALQIANQWQAKACPVFGGNDA